MPMSTVEIVEPDLEFMAQLKSMGSETFNKCYQCANCTAVCDVTPKDYPFPRKEMIWAQWGQKDKLIYNPSIWLCHLCGDCTAHCPRGARPSDLLAAVRNISYTVLAVPASLGKLLSKPALFPLFFGLGAALIAGVMAAWGAINPAQHPGFGVIFNPPAGEVIYSKMFSIHKGANSVQNMAPGVKVIDSLFLPVMLFVIIVSVLTILKMWKNMKAHYPYNGPVKVVPALISTIIDILTHKNFHKCTTNKPLGLGHMATLWGFILLFIATNLVLFFMYGKLWFGMSIGGPTPFELPHIVKVTGYLGALLTMVGLTGMLLRRFLATDKLGKPVWTDWNFIIAIYGTILTGVLCVFFRLGDMPGIAYPTYYIHLVFVFFLLAYLPYSKFAHLLYRSTAMVFNKAVELGRASQSSGSAAPAPAPEGGEEKKEETAA